MLEVSVGQQFVHAELNRNAPRQDLAAYTNLADALQGS